MTTARRRLLVAALLALLCGVPAAADELTDDLVARRTRVMQRLGPDAMLVMWSAPPRLYSRDTYYPYRQDSNLYYLTGITQPDTMLVLMPGNESQKEVLFIADKDRVREHWDGRRLTSEDATARSGVSTVLSNAQFDGFISGIMNSRGFGPVSAAETVAFSSALAAGRAAVSLVLEPHELGEPLTRELEFAGHLRTGYPGVTVSNALPILTDLRLIKSDYERRMLARSLEISGEAQLAGMRAGRPGAYEYEVRAALEAVHVARGAIGWSFPSIISSGPNTTILHNPYSDRRIEDGDLVLMDAAANYEYLAGDLTRTFPANGRFSDPQREIYELVLAAQEAGMAAAVPGTRLMDVHRRVVDVLRNGLLELGLITDASGEQYRRWFTHGSVHYLGVDVHDVGDIRRPLEPGMAFVIEPGLYIRRDALDGLPATGENMAFIEATRSAVARYLDIGIRIEDAFILEKNGLRHLTASVPRTIDELEAFLR